MPVDIGPRIGIDGEKEFRKELQNINQQLRTLGSEMKAVTSAFDENTDSQEALAAQAQVLNRQIDAQKQKLSQLEKGLQMSAEKYGENDSRTQKWAQAVQDATATLNRMQSQLSKVHSEMSGAGNVYDNLTRKISNQESELEGLRKAHTNAVLTYGKTSREAGDLAAQIKDLSLELGRNKTAMQQAEQATDGLSTSFSGAGNSAGGLSGLLGSGGLGGVLSKGLAVGAVVGGIQQITGALTAFVDETAEYRRIMGTLEVSSQAAGYTAEQTAETYTRLYSVLGDNQTAATATANLQAIKLSQEDLMEVTDAAIGAWATYGDSIPIDSLAESINETIRAGTVTGTFADVLNWGSQEGETFGVTMRESTEANKEWNDAVAACETAEDYFNLALQDCQTEAERADLVMQAMAKQGLQESADAWKENNQDIIDTNTSQAEFEEAQARLAEKLTPVKDAITDLGTAGFNFLADSVDTVSGAIDDLIGWWDDLIGKIQRGWNDFWGIEQGSRDMSSRGTGFVDGSHAKGLDYVPFDGYIAELHRGEMVIPRSQADVMRSMGISTEMADTMTRSVPVGPSYRSSVPSSGSGTSTDSRPIELSFNFSTELDGQTLARRQYKYVARENNLRGGSLVEVGVG